MGAKASPQLRTWPPDDQGCRNNIVAKIGIWVCIQVRFLLDILKSSLVGLDNSAWEFD